MVSSSVAQYCSPMRLTKFRAISIVFLFCAALEVYVCIQFQGPAPVEFFDKSAGVRNASNNRFSAERALEIHRRVFPDSPHPAGSVENAVVRAQIVQLLEEHGWLVDPAEKSPKSEKEAPATPASHGNIIARRPEQATMTTKPIVLASHFDSCPVGPGVGDAGICVAAVIEAGRLLTLDTRDLKHPVWLLLTDAEESGLQGARNFVKSHPLSRQQPLVLNFDARGNSGPVVMFETHAGNHQAIQQFINQLVRPKLTGSLFTAIYKSLPNGTDFTVFRDAGWQGFNFALIDGAQYYHRPDDTLENLDHRSVQHLGDTALGVGGAMARSDDALENPSEDAIFFDVLGLIVMHIPVSSGFPVRFALLFAAVQVYGRRLIKERQFRSVLRVWLTMALIVPLASGLGWLISRSIRGTILLPRPFVAHGHWLSLAMWFLCLGFCSLLAHSLLRRIHQRRVWDAFWLAHAATCMVVSIFIPEFSHLLSIPAALALVSTLLISNVLLRTLVVGCLSSILLIPLHHLLSIAVGPANGLILFPLFSLVIMPLLPAFAASDVKSPAKTTTEIPNFS